jgi:hypothetical protein
MINAVKLGFADSSDPEVRSHMNSLEIQARGGRQAPAAKPTEQSLAGFGISVETFE